MADKYRTIKMGGEGEIVEKKSRFIAHVFHIESEEEAAEYIQAMKKKYYDARHNCHAYVIGPDKEISRFSDDGEPSGTAGKPILEVINGEELTDTLVVVTRYFGGTLLGTGGLIRAYSDAAKVGLSHSDMIWMEKGSRLSIKVAYTEESKVRRYLMNKEYKIEDALYSEEVDIISIIPTPALEKTMAELTDSLAGKVKLEVGDEVWG